MVSQVLVAAWLACWLSCPTTRQLDCDRKRTTWLESDMILALMCVYDWVAVAGRTRVRGAEPGGEAGGPD